MNNKIKIRRSHVDTIETENRVFEVMFQPDGVVEPTVYLLPDGTAVIGYLAHDDDCENPLGDCDGMGHIYDARRQSGRESRQRYFAATGRDEDGYKSDELTPDPLAVPLDVYSHSGDVWRVHGSGVRFCDERWDVSNCAGVWVPDDCCREHINTQLDYTTKRAEAVKCATQAVDVYNEWLSGACYGVCVETFTANNESVDDEACWGFIGEKHAAESLSERVKEVLTKLTKGAT